MLIVNVVVWVIQSIFHNYTLIQNIWLFVEICDEGSLYDYVRNLDNPLTKELQQQWAMEIAKGMFMLWQSHAEMNNIPSCILIASAHLYHVKDGLHTYVLYLMHPQNTYEPCPWWKFSNTVLWIVYSKSSIQIPPSCEEKEYLHTVTFLIAESAYWDFSRIVWYVHHMQVIGLFKIDTLTVPCDGSLGLGNETSITVNRHRPQIVAALEY